LHVRRLRRDVLIDGLCGLCHLPPQKSSSGGRATRHSRSLHKHGVEMFTPQSRELVRERLLDVARADARITGGAVTGSMANGTEDDRSDLDLAFGVAASVDPEAVLCDWTKLVMAEFRAVHHFDLRAGSAIYRVFLLPDGLEVDIGLWPAGEFGATG